MEVTARSYGVLGLTYCVPVRHVGRRFRTTLAKRKEFQDNGNTQKRPSFPLRVSKSVLARAAIGVFGLGFIDAGYSGDWSRIGVITPEIEELIKVAAFLVAPLCIFLIIFLPSEPST
ncbi:hypothetical protein Fmac_013001 [Flemingia macrophylla]|uniref:DUF7887 domain-containing protein n=1 Tax=Flemingia macrophylla TaxID=520843 RepID=A0ABD1MU58_9FABA